MADNIGTLVAAPIRPASDEDTFPSAYANEIMGGFHAVATLEARDAIPAERRVEGMFCAVTSTEPSTIYQLLGGLENDNWQRLAVYEPDWADIGDYITFPVNGPLFGFMSPRYYQWLSGKIDIMEPHDEEAPLRITIEVNDDPVAAMTVQPGYRTSQSVGFPITFHPGDRIRTVLSGAGPEQEFYYNFEGLAVPPLLNEPTGDALFFGEDLHWVPVYGAVRYNVRITSGEDVLVDDTTDRPWYAIQREEQTACEWQVQPVFADQTEGAFSPKRALTIYGPNGPEPEDP